MSARKHEGLCGSARRGVVSAAVEILLITSEIAPYSRSGELGDVCAALPKALRGLGHKVTVISPLWSGIDPTARGLARRLTSIEVNLGAWRGACTLHDGRTTGGVELVFVGQAETFATGPGQGSREAQLRAALVFASAAAQVAAARQPAPEVLHAHGWFAAGALALAQAELPSAARVLSLHDARQDGDLGALPDGVVLPSALLGKRAPCSRAHTPRSAWSRARTTKPSACAQARRRSRARCTPARSCSASPTGSTPRAGIR